MLVSKNLLIRLLELWEYQNSKKDKHGRIHSDKNGQFERKPLSEYLGCEYKKYIVSSLKDLLGDEITGVKGQEAVNKVFEEKKGHVKNAFYRKSIGNISVCWGDDSCGLRHIILQRHKRKNNPLEIIRKIGFVISKGSIHLTEENKYEIIFKNYKVVVSTELKGEEHIGIITGFKMKKVSES